ncbi:AraC-type DNA-binding protein [Chitinophaga costaii]|uniref:AraC-type DNA-binding protein n=1 Tax=Chitinophaga costaii TaxID=1335309 RepID=A0A1C4DTS3_9BACT|nr:response regulator transcription factor [Chitinophaga costaii]PUZ27787.1 AraC family transcriptional regulator [Chitinophaga costaii]SCC34739.1 AraC-type DNA-binding protein [Chitinophaga costaii]
MAHFRQFAFKQFGYFDFYHNLPNQLAQQDYKSFVKIVFLKAGGHVVVDFQEYQLEQDALFFINAGQYYRFDTSCIGTLLYYNRDFYCVEIHDKEVACDGILFHNVYEIPVIFMEPATSDIMQGILREIKIELAQEDSGLEEMLRILLKQLIIRATRIWKHTHQVDNEDIRQEVEFSRTFSQLVEWHYTRFHTVAEYAELLHITPKALNKRITRYSQTTPNEVIKSRIMLEAKRLLAHTPLSVKEIGYKLGYDDSSYFIRLFTKQAGASPQFFRQQYQQA